MTKLFVNEHTRAVARDGSLAARPNQQFFIKTTNRERVQEWGYCLIAACNRDKVERALEQEHDLVRTSVDSPVVNQSKTGSLHHQTTPHQNKNASLMADILFKINK